MARRTGMWDRIWNGTLPPRRQDSRIPAHPATRSRRRPLVERLEDRQLMTASLAPLTNITVPSQMGFQQPLNGSGNTNGTQTYTVSSDNPDIAATVAQGQFWTLLVSHAPANSTDITINNEPLTFQFFQNQAPQTVSRITNLTNGSLTGSNYFTTTGKFFPRIAKGFVAQGGSNSPTSLSSSSGVPGINSEIVQQLAFTGTAQLAMANAGAGTATNDAQFFVTFGPQAAARLRLHHLRPARRRATDADRPVEGRRQDRCRLSRFFDRHSRSRRLRSRPPRSPRPIPTEWS